MTSRTPKLICLIDKMFKTPWLPEFESLSKDIQAKKFSMEIDLMVNAHDVMRSYQKLIEQSDALEAETVELAKKLSELKGITVVL